eukprot:1120210-Rhodomonas_salina.1
MGTRVGERAIRIVREIHILREEIPLEPSRRTWRCAALTLSKRDARFFGSGGPSVQEEAYPAVASSQYYYYYYGRNYAPMNSSGCNPSAINNRITTETVELTNSTPRRVDSTELKPIRSTAVPLGGTDQGEFRDSLPKHFGTIEILDSRHVLAHRRQGYGKCVGTGKLGTVTGKSLSKLVFTNSPTLLRLGKLQ